MADPYYQQQQYRHPDPKISGHRDENAPPRRHNNAPSEASTYDPSHFPPPPRTARNHDERSVADSYPGSEARNGQALAPYDDEKAYAQYSDAYGAPDYGRRSQAAPSEYGRSQAAPSEYGRSQAAPSEYGARRSHPPPPSDYDRGERRRDDDRRYDDRPRRDEPRERRRNSRPPPSDDSFSDDGTYARDYERRHGASEDGNAKGKDKKARLMEKLRSVEGERGLGATLLGAAGGAFLGDQLASKNGKGKGSKGESALGTIGGALVGAIGANAAERQIGKREKDKESGKDGRDRGARRSHMDEYAAGGDDPYGGGRAKSRDRSRGVDEFRQKRADRRGEPRRRRRDSSSDSYTSDE